MFGTFGFSYVGLLYLLMLFVPNILWARHQPQGYSPAGENKILLFCERVGQVLVTCAALFFSDYNLKPWSAWSLWLVASFALMLLYEAYWVRYFCSEQTVEDFYSSFLGIPVPGATLPVLTFILLGIYGKVVWMLAAALLLGIGHIGIHLQHRSFFIIKGETT